MPLEQTVGLGLAPVGQQLAHIGLGIVDALTARPAGEAARQELLGAVIQLAQQLALPAVPDGRADGADVGDGQAEQRSEEHTSELQSLMRISYAVFCLTKKKRKENRI